VDESGTMMVLGFLGDFGDAIDFIFHKREAAAGGIDVGGTQLLGLLWTHLELCAVSLAIAVAVSVPLGLYLGHKRRGEFLAVSASNIGRAVPSFALIAFFVAYLGVGFKNVTLALVLLAIPPILTNTFVGVSQVDRDTVDAARGMGLTELEIMRGVELPLALPLMFGGLKTSAVNVVATATIAPYAGVLTLGDPIIAGTTYGQKGQLGASMLVAVLAIITELGLTAVQRVVTPTGLKVGAQGSARRSRFPFPKRRIEATT
jgi:osmoprotectant transport system permease protein